MTICVYMFHDIIFKQNIINIPYYNERLCNTECCAISFYEFKNIIDNLMKKYTIISTGDFLNDNYDKYKDNCILTFDDGTLCHFKYVYPYLKKKKISGSFFITGKVIFEKKVLTPHKIHFLLSHFKINLNELIINIRDIFLQDNNIEKFLSLWNTYKKSTYINNDWSSQKIFITNILRNDDYLYIGDILFNKFILKNLTEEQFANSMYMNYEQITEMHKNNMEIGSHSYTHNTNETFEKCRKMKEFLQKIDVKNYIFSYPCGNTSNYDLYKKNGFVAGFTVKPGCIDTNIDKLKLGRYKVVKNMVQTKKIVICGMQRQCIEICKFLIQNNINIDYIVTIKNPNNNKASGWVDYSEFAKQYSIPIYYCKSYSLKKKEDFDFFNEHNFDILLLGGWQRLIPEIILNTLKWGAIGQHGSSELLPKGRGRSPINWSIITNRKRIVWNIFKIAPGIDDGDIIDYRIININDFDTCDTIYKKIGIIVKNMYLENIPKIFNNNVKLIHQIGDATFYKKRTPSDGLINWSKSKNEIYNLIRAVTKPYPGAFTYNTYDKIMIWKAHPFDDNILYYGKQNGEVVEIFDDNSFLINCCDGTLLVTEHTSKNIYKGDILASEINYQTTNPPSTVI